jgi:hypothetical protein
MAGEVNPFAGADFDASWQHTSVTEEQWRALRVALRQEAEKWQGAVGSREAWDDSSATIALSTAVHTAYHVGAIRQILAGLQSV